MTDLGGDSTRSESPEPPSQEVVNAAIAELTGVIERAEMSRAALVSLDASLASQVDHRRDLVDRIDSALNDRQMHLVTDILRAESERRALGDAVESVLATIESIRADVAHAVTTGKRGPVPGGPPIHGWGRDDANVRTASSTD